MTAVLGAVERVAVPLGQRSYDVLVGDGLLDRAADHLSPVLGTGRRLVIVTDETVAGLHLERLQAGLGQAAPVVAVPPGEASKSWAGLEQLVDRLLGLGVDRGTVLLALGGGVIGDLAGFAAAILLRGLDFVQLPTTLLAQVDSSVGGKTAINTAAGKNLVGSFHQPRLVLADIGALATLPVREVRAGYAEVVKHAVIADAAFFDWLEANGAVLVAGDPAARRTAVLHSCRTKARVVAADEREAGLRALLNFGHTFGHALEAETGFGARLLHGEAVAVGMGLALDLSARLCGCPATAAERVRRHLAAVGAPARLADVPGPALAADALVHHMWGDKKTRDGALTFVLARALGDALVRSGVPVDAVTATLIEAGASASAA